MRVREDVTLVKMSLNSDQSAFGELIDRYKNLVYGLLLSRIRDFDQVEYLAQDTFIEAYVNLGKIRKPANFSSWLCGIATNLCNRWLERQRRESEVMGELSLFGEEAEGVLTIQNATVPKTPEEEYELQEMKKAIWKAIGELPEKSREAILLFYFNDMSHIEISMFLGVAPSTVLSHLQNGREKLESKMIPFVEVTVKEKALGRKFTEKVKSALPLISFPDQKPVAPLLKWGLSSKGILTGIGALALIGGFVGWLASGQEESELPEEESFTPKMMQTRLASAQEKALLASNLEGDKSSAESEEATYPIKHATEPPTSLEITGTFMFLGITQHRLVYEVPFQHKITYTCDYFIDGQRMGIDHRAQTRRISPGEHSLTIFVRESDDQLKITVGDPYPSISYHPYDITGYDAVRKGRIFQEPLILGKKVPLFVWVANSEESDNTSFGFHIRAEQMMEDIGKVASEYDFLVAIFVELGRDLEEEVTGRKSFSELAQVISDSLAKGWEVIETENRTYKGTIQHRVLIRNQKRQALDEKLESDRKYSALTQEISDSLASGWRVSGRKYRRYKEGDGSLAIWQRMTLRKRRNK